MYLPYFCQVAFEDTPIIEALHKFVYKRVSALPIVDSEVPNSTNTPVLWIRNYFFRIRIRLFRKFRIRIRFRIRLIYQ